MVQSESCQEESYDGTLEADTSASSASAATAAAAGSDDAAAAENQGYNLYILAGHEAMQL